MICIILLNNYVQYFIIMYLYTQVFPVVVQVLLPPIQAHRLPLIRWTIRQLGVRDKGEGSEL